MSDKIIIWIKTLFTISILIFVSKKILASSNYSPEKINSPEYAEEVVQMGEYQRWKINGVWYSNAPLEQKFLFKTTGAEDFTINPFAQPNDTSMVYYGSGDVDSNNVRDWNDHNLISQGIQNDQSDIDGDGIPGTLEDAGLFAKYLNADTLLPQINWAWPNMTRESRKDWVKKMLAIDKTNEIPPVQGEWMCGDYSWETCILFHGFPELNNPEIAQHFPEYSTENNGRFNLPVYNVSIRGTLSHFINGILIGDNPLDFYDYYFFDVSRNDKEVVIGDVLMPENSKVTINYTVRFCDDGGISQLCIAEFKFNNGVPTLEYSSHRLILQRPDVNSIKPNKPNLLEKFVLNQNYPNPFNSQTKIKYSIPLEDKVKLQVYDVLGKLVKTLVNEKQKAGEYAIDFDASGLSSGVYFYRIETSAGVSKTKKFTILK